MLKKYLKALAAALVMAAVAAVSAQAVQANAIDDRVVILDPGHGTAGSPGYGSYNEAVAMLGLANRIRPLLEAQGVTVHMTRTGEANVPLPVRAAKINIWGLEAVREARQLELGGRSLPDVGAVANRRQGGRNVLSGGGVEAEIAEIDRLIGIMQNIVRDYERYAPVYFNFPYDQTHQRRIHSDLRRLFEIKDSPVIAERFLMISLHSDASSNSDTNGATAYHVYNGHTYAGQAYFRGYSHGPLSAQFGRQLLDGIAGIGIRSRGTRPAMFMVLREINMPAVLMENGFHTNAGDRALLSSSSFMDRLARVYADTVAAHFRAIEVTPPPEPAPELPEEPEEIGYELLSEPELYKMARSFAIYRAPDFGSTRVAVYPAQEVIIRARAGNGWALISTARGEHWVYAPEYELLEQPERYFIARQFSIHRSPNALSDRITSFRPQEVIIRARAGNGWALISTARGRYWVHLGA